MGDTNSLSTRVYKHMTLPMKQKLSFAFSVAAMLVVFLAYSHSGYITDSVLTYSQIISRIISIFYPSNQVTEPGFVAGHGITEDKAVLIFFCGSLLMAVIALMLAVWHRVSKGVSRYFIPLVFLSLCVMGCVLYVGYELQLHNYA